MIAIKKNSSNPIVTSGHYACLLSHIKAIKLAKSRNYQNIMILEDDVYFDNDFINKLSRLTVPKYEMIYLGGIISKKKIFLCDWAYSSKNKIMGAYAYILTQSIYDKILTKLEKILDYVDFVYMEQIQPYYKVLLLNDFIKTDLSSTDTSHKSKKLIKRLQYIK
jgi:GR25 family glycosyltransferase involved in LPS biosynthesis